MKEVECPEDKTYLVLAFDDVNATTKSGRCIIKVHVKRTKLSYWGNKGNSTVPHRER